MDRGNVAFFQAKVGEKAFTILFDPSSSIDEIRTALFAFSKEVDAIEEKIKNPEEPKEVNG